MGSREISGWQPKPMGKVMICCYWADLEASATITGSGPNSASGSKGFFPERRYRREDCQWRTTTGRRMPVVLFVAGVLSIWLSSVEERPGDWLLWVKNGRGDVTDLRWVRVAKLLGGLGSRRRNNGSALSASTSERWESCASRTGWDEETRSGPRLAVS